MKSQIDNLGKVSPTFEGGYNNEKPYDRLCCVIDPDSGCSYISRRPVPAGVSITNNKYWQLLAIGTNRVPLVESLGDDSFRAITQKYITKLWKEQYDFNETVKDSVELSEKTLEAIKLLSPEQQEALSLAVAVVETTKKLDTIEKQLNGYTLVIVDEITYETMKNNNELNESTIYFTYEKEEETEEEDDFE